MIAMCRVTLVYMSQLVTSDDTIEILCGTREIGLINCHKSFANKLYNICSVFFKTK